MKSIIPYLILLTILGTLPYLHTLNYPFVFDDYANIIRNPHIQLEHFDLPSIRRALENRHFKKRPVSYVTFVINHHFGKDNPKPYRIFNLLIHTLNGLLVFWFVRMVMILYRSRSITGLDSDSDNNSEHVKQANFLAFFAAAIWLIHPVQIQSVTYTSQRMNSMAVFFYMAALIAYVAGRRLKPGYPRVLIWSCGVLSWGLSLGCKEIAATLPVVVLLCEWYFFQDLRLRWILKHWKICGIIAAAIALISMSILGADPTRLFSKLSQRTGLSPVTRQFTEFRVVVFYLTLLLFPVPSRFNLEHHFPVSSSIMQPPATVLSLVVLVLVFCSGIRFARTNRRLLSFCVVWFFVHSAIESTFIPIELAYEHRLYLPSIGFAIMATSVYNQLTFATVNRLRFGVPLLVIIGLSLSTYQRNKIWRDNLTLWSDCAAKSPNLALVQNNLGFALLERAKNHDAARHFQRAVEIKPYDAGAHNNLGLALERLVNADQAISHYRTAIEQKPGYADAFNNLGHALFKQGEIDDAIENFRHALKLKRNFAVAHNNLGDALNGMGNIDEAIGHYQLAIDIKPDYKEAYNNFAVALSKKNQFDQAISLCRQALDIDPEYADAHNNLGIILSKSGKLQDALRHFTKAVQIDPENDEMKKNLEIAKKRTIQ